MKKMYSIIPKPQKYDALDGGFSVSSGTAIVIADGFEKAKAYLASFLETKEDAADGAIKFEKDGSLRSEAYALNVSSNGVSVRAADENGAFYAAVTLKIMLLQADKKDGAYTLCGADIYDYPKFSFRSGMLDESRHFFGKDIVKRLLDNMALLKLNKFHWHLSDDQGFRIESELYPLLNTVGSKRADMYLHSEGNIEELVKHDGGEYYHYYKKDEIREVVAYAKSLCIDIIPEIDMPGHTVAWTAAYKDLSCLKGDYEVFGYNGITKDILCVGQEETYDFIEELLGEITELFPYEYFHIGGDEAAKGHKLWQTECPVCKAKIAELGLKNGAQLQEYFSNRVNKILNKFGKTCVEWNDGFGDKTDGNIICQYWFNRGPLWLMKESKRRKFIISPDPYFYFDETYARTSLKRAYNFKPIKVGFTGAKSNILGLEFETWTEWIVNEEALQFSVFPRIFALAELAWTEDKKRKYNDFYGRLDFFKDYMKKQGVNYSRLEGKNSSVLNKTVYHLGDMGPEYKLSEKLRSGE